MKKSLIVLCAILLLFSGTTAVNGQDKPKENEQAVVWNKINLYLITKWVQEQTGKKFLISPEVRTALEQKNVTFITDKIPTKPDEVFALYESILQVNKLLLAKVGEGQGTIYKIIPQEASLKHPTEYVEGDKMDALQDKFITRLFTIEYVSVQEVHMSLNKLLTDPNGIVSIPSANALLVMDYDYNVDRIAKIIKEMDKPKPDISIKKIELERALATDVESMLTNLMQTIIARAVTPGAAPSRGSQQETFRVVADKRTNSVIILAESKQRMDQILELVKKLDDEAKSATTGAYLYHLKHTNAEDMMATLNAIYGISTRRSGGTSSTPAAIGPSTPPPSGTPIPTISQGAASTSPIQGAPIIVADVPTNSLIIVTDKNTYQALTDLVGKLDIRKPQVLIKASIVEIKGTDKLDFGTELATIGSPGDNARGFGISKFGMSTLIDTDGDKIPDARVPVDTPGITLGLFKEKYGNIPALFQALKVKSHIEILSEPEALTNDNEKAKLSVKDSIPYKKTTTTGTGIVEGGFGGTNDAGTTLEITPHISEGQYLRLETKLAIDRFTEESADPSLPPPSSKRELETTITIPNGRTVVIGGLVTQDKTDGQSGVPILSDIPIVGALFSKVKRVNENRTLYLFITPYILYDEQFGDVKDLTQKRIGNIEKLTGEDARFFEKEADDPTPRSTFQFRVPEKKERQ